MATKRCCIKKVFIVGRIIGRSTTVAGGGGGWRDPDMCSSWWERYQKKLKEAMDKC